MKVARTAPFLTAPEDSVSGVPWKRVLEDGEHPLEDAIPSWDPALDLRFMRTVSVTPALVRDGCRLPDDAQLVLVSTWQTGTALRGPAQRHIMEGSQPATLRLETRVSGADLAGTVQLKTVLVLGQSVPRAPLRPFRAGSVLWEDAQEVLLEGSGSRFPMEIISFSNSRGFPSGAGWLLDWQASELEQSVLGGLRLYLNSDHKRILEAVRHPLDPSYAPIMEAIRFDVARQLIRGALQNDEFIAHEGPYPKETVGRVIHRLLKSRFRGYTPESLRNEMKLDADRFDALLQDKMGLFEGLV